MNNKILLWEKFRLPWKWVYGEAGVERHIKKVLWRGNACTISLGDSSNSFLQRRGDKFFLVPPEEESERYQDDSQVEMEINPEAILNFGFGNKDGQTITQALSDTEDGERVSPEEVEWDWS